MKDTVARIRRDKLKIRAKRNRWQAVEKYLPMVLVITMGLVSFGVKLI